MIGFLRRLFNRPERHYPVNSTAYTHHALCACGHTSVWDYDLRRHFEEQGRIGK
jgi:hypothetical protein